MDAINAAKEQTKAPDFPNLCQTLGPPSNSTRSGVCPKLFTREKISARPLSPSLPPSALPNHKVNHLDLKMLVHLDQYSARCDVDQTVARAVGVSGWLAGSRTQNIWNTWPPRSLVRSLARSLGLRPKLSPFSSHALFLTDERMEEADGGRGRTRADADGAMTK